MIIDRQRREKEIEINKLTRDFEILGKEKEELLENFKQLEKSHSNHEQKSAKVLELEATVIFYHTESRMSSCHL